MSQSLSNVQLHLVFGTKNRQPLIIPEIENELYAYLTSLGKNVDCKILTIGGISNHVHILLVMGRCYPIAKVVQHLKANSCKWLHRKGYKKFAWQGGYGIFSISESQVVVCSRYIANQKQHHTKVAFEDEYRAILKKYNVEYNEQYLWS